MAQSVRLCWNRMRPAVLAALAVLLVCGLNTPAASSALGAIPIPAYGAVLAGTATWTTQSSYAHTSATTVNGVTMTESFQAQVKGRVTYTLVAGAAVHASASYLSTTEHLIERTAATGSSRTDEVTTIRCTDQGMTQPDSFPAIQAGQPYYLNLSGMVAACTQHYRQVVDGKTMQDRTSPDVEPLPAGSPLPEPHGPVVIIADPTLAGHEGYTGYLGPDYVGWETYGHGYSQWTWALVIVYLNGVRLRSADTNSCTRQMPSARTLPTLALSDAQPLIPGHLESRAVQRDTCTGRWRGTIRDSGNTSISILASYGSQQTATWHFEWHCDETLRFAPTGDAIASGRIEGKVTVTDDRTGQLLKIIELKTGGSAGNGATGGSSPLTITRQHDGSLLARWQPLGLLATALVDGVPVGGAIVYCIPTQNASGAYGIRVPSQAGPGEVLSPTRMTFRQTYPSGLSVDELQYFANLSVTVFGPPGHRFIAGTQRFVAPTLPLPRGEQLNRSTVQIDLSR